MTELDTEAILNDYVARHPAARAALFGDPVFKVQMDSLRRTLDLLVPALRREGVDPVSARRVVNTVVYGSPDPDAAIERMAEEYRQVELAKWATPRLVVDAETAASLMRMTP